MLVNVNKTQGKQHNIFVAFHSPVGLFYIISFFLQGTSELASLQSAYIINLTKKLFYFILNHKYLIGKIHGKKNNHLPYSK